MASVQGQIIDALETLWRMVVTDLRPGEQGFLRGKRNVESWGDAKLPYLMAHSPGKEETPLGAHRQIDATYAVAFELWTLDWTQEQLLQSYDDFRLLLRGDPTLGLVRDSWTSQMGMDEATGKRMRALGVVVICQRIEG